MTPINCVLPVHKRFKKSPKEIASLSSKQAADFLMDVVDVFYASQASRKSGAALSLALIPCPFSRLSPLNVGNIGIEMKLSEFKHRMEQLTEVAKDVVTATHGMAMELEKRARKDEKSRDDTVFFVPVIVTTAKLFIARADVTKVALTDGKLAIEGFELQELPWLVYEYSLPAELLLPVNAGSDRWSSEREDILRRRHILIVNSEHLQQFLVNLHQNLALPPASPLESLRGGAVALCPDSSE